MTLDLNFSLFDLNGNEMPDSHVGKMLAEALFFSKDQDNYLKFYEWAQTLHKGGSITIDSQDEKTLKEFIKKAGFPVVTQYAFQLAFDGKKPVKPEKEESKIKKAA